MLLQSLLINTCFIEIISDIAGAYFQFTGLFQTSDKTDNSFLWFSTKKWCPRQNGNTILLSHTCTQLQMYHFKQCHMKMDRVLHHSVLHVLVSHYIVLHFGRADFKMYHCESKFSTGCPKKIWILLWKHPLHLPTCPSQIVSLRIAFDFTPRSRLLVCLGVTCAPRFYSYCLRLESTCRRRREGKESVTRERC